MNRLKYRKNYAKQSKIKNNSIKLANNIEVLLKKCQIYIKQFLIYKKLNLCMCGNQKTIYLYMNKQSNPQKQDKIKLRKIN